LFPAGGVTALEEPLHGSDKEAILPDLFLSDLFLPDLGYADDIGPDLRSQ
jgi:hypothetical protein